MAKAKEPKIVLERVYNVPLRKEYMKVPRWKRTKKAVTGLRQFLQKHMKSEDVKISRELNEKLWQHGIKNPPHHIKVSVTKDDVGGVKAGLFGVKKAEAKKEKKEEKILKEEKGEPAKAKEETAAEQKSAKPKKTEELPKAVEEKV